MLLCSITACTNSNDKDINERITLWRNDKIPYGAFYFYNQLPYLFPKAEIIVDKESPANKELFQKKNSDLFIKLSAKKGRSVEIIIAPQVIPGKKEYLALMDFVSEGNQVFISSFSFGHELLDSLKLDIKYSYSSEKSNDSLRTGIRNPLTWDEALFNYPGIYYESYFSKFDSGFTNVLGWNENRGPNFIKIGYESGGAIYLHLAPLAFSNFFLLHKDNNKYYEYALSNLPKGIELVVWNEYFRNHVNSEGNGSSISRAFSWLMKQPALAIAIWLLLLLFAFIYLFESKRKQKIIPIRKPLQNSSLEFVKTIGRLYFQRKDNKNLAGKMTANFLEQVRSKYNLPTTRLDEAFEKKLAFKTGIEHTVIRNILYQARYISDQSFITDAELLQFNNQLQQFYKQV